MEKDIKANTKQKKGVVIILMSNQIDCKSKDLRTTNSYIWVK